MSMLQFQSGLESAFKANRPHISGFHSLCSTVSEHNWVHFKWNYSEAAHWKYTKWTPVSNAFQSMKAALIYKFISIVLIKVDISNKIPHFSSANSPCYSTINEKYICFSLENTQVLSPYHYV